MIAIDKKDIETRKALIETTRKTLKDQFVGIDLIIDDLLDYIQVWYLMPEVLNRPIIVNLWGMTGVGKTDLIRKMVKSLNFQDRFIEVELSNIDSTSWQSSVASVLQNNDLADERPSIVLFDEIQRFNTIDQEGKPIQQTKYMDFWELLSDGRLSKKSKDDLDYYIYNYMTKKKDVDAKKWRGEVVTKEEENPVLGLWDARELKKVLKLDTPIEEMMQITESEMIEMIVSAKKKKKIYEPVNFAKTLILISGNLDEAFNMANETSETDVDADIFHAFTEKITMVDVKNALGKKFRPEQVARFGNIHIIYTSLKRENFEKLIARDIERIVRESAEKIGIKLVVDKSIHDLIYKNGVFPVQGVRPVFSSIIDILEANLSKFFYEAIMKGEHSVSIGYDTEKKSIVWKVWSKVVTIPYIGRIDKIRASNEVDTVANISVHECGHAIAYMVLFGLAPLQLKSRIASSYAGGFTFPHSIHETKDHILSKIKIYLAGWLAEEIIFGEHHASVGRSSDRETATQLTLDYVRKYGFDEEFQANYTLEWTPYIMDKSITDLDVEKMISRLVWDTKEILRNHIDLLRDLSTVLAEKWTMTPKEMQSYAKKHELPVDVKPEWYLVIHGFERVMNEK
jgi:Peptidase family M41/ATPase family associated with various cellular activities (AAA)